MVQTIGVRGTAGTLGVLAAAKVIDMADKIFYLEPSNNQLVLLASRLGKSIVHNPEYKHLEGTNQARYDRVNNGAGYTSAAASITVDDASVYRAGYLIRNIKDSIASEIMRVTSIASGASPTVIAVDRSWGATAAAAGDNDDILLIVGDSFAEGADALTPISTSPTAKTTYTQIFRDSYGVTRTENNTKMYGMQEMARLAFEAGLTHAEKIERAFFFGEKNEDTSGNHAIRTTSGLDELITTNRTSDASLVKLDMHDFLRTKAFADGSDEKWGFCSPIIAGAIDWFAQDQGNTFVHTEKFGIKIKQWVTSFGVLNIITHRGLLKWGFDGSTGYGGKMFVVDPAKVGYRHIANSDTHIKQNIQGNGEDQVKNEYLTECGLHLKNEACHALLEDVTAYSVS